MHRQKILLILIVLILLIIIMIMYNKSNNKLDNKLNYKNLRNNIHKKYPKSDYVLEIDDPDLSFSDNVMTSVDTINLYPSQYPYTFGYKPYYYRLYPYPLRPQYHYHKKDGKK